MPSPTRRILSAAVGAALLMSACSSDDDAAPATTDSPVSTTAPELTTTTTATTTSAPTTTTTAAPTTTAETTTTTAAPTTVATTTTTPPTTSPPPSTNPGDPNWVEIVQGLLATYNEIQANPDIDRIAEFCLGGENPCQDMQGAEVRQFVEDGWRVEGVPTPTVLRAEVIDSIDELPEPIRQYVLRVQTEAGDLTEAAVVSVDGEKLFDIENDPGQTVRTFNIRLQRVGDEWRVLGIASVEN
jgi:hypothetical protein